MRCRVLSIAALVVALVAATAAPPAQAQVTFLASGQVGSVLLLNFYGGYEGYPSNRSDSNQAAVQCWNSSNGRKAVFAGAAVQAYDAHAGRGNDWQYARLIASAITRDGHGVTGDTTGWFVVDDTRLGVLPAVGVWLPRDNQTYTPVLGVELRDPQFVESGAVLLGAQTGSTMTSWPWFPYGAIWQTYRADGFYQC